MSKGIDSRIVKVCKLRNRAVKGETSWSEWELAVYELNQDQLRVYMDLVSLMHDAVMQNALLY